MKVNTIRTFEIELPEPIVIECQHCNITERVDKIYLDQKDALELYSQLDNIFGIKDEDRY